MADPRFVPSPLTTPEGDAWGPPAGGGEISAGHYEGSEAQRDAPWKCPACGVQNEGRVALGCTSCGSGKPGFHVGVPDVGRYASRASNLTPADPNVRQSSSPMTWLPQDDIISGAFVAWRQAYGAVDRNIFATENEKLTEAAFRAGWIAGAQNQARQTMAVPPVTADVASLAPEGKPRRTLAAALAHFRDHVLALDPEEIATGEWCSVEEVDQLILTLQAGLDT